jgi:hypothetical protein
MAKIYSAPKSIKVPSICGQKYSDYCIAARKYRKEVSDFCKASNKGELVGEIISTSVADGTADYVIYKERPFELIHLNDGDGYSGSPAWCKGINLRMAKAQINCEKQLKAIFGE